MKDSDGRPGSNDASNDDGSDDTWTVARHLDGRPEFAVELYAEFIRMVGSLGPFTYSVSKSMITVKGARRGFAGARPVAAGLRGYFDLQREVRDRRITSASPYTSRLFVHRSAS